MVSGCQSFVSRIDRRLVLSPLHDARRATQLAASVLVYGNALSVVDGLPDTCNFTKYYDLAGCLCDYRNGTVACVEQYMGLDLWLDTLFQGGSGRALSILVNKTDVHYVCTSDSAVAGYAPSFGFQNVCPT